MLRIIKMLVKLLINVVVVTACFGFFVLFYIVLLIGELGTNKPKLATS